MLKRLLGLIITLTGIAGILISVAIYQYGQGVVDSAAVQAIETLDLVNTTLSTTNDTLIVAKDSINEVSNTLNTVSDTAVTLSQTVSETEPLLDQIGTIATEQVPDSLEAVEATIPNIASVAGTIDNTLTILSTFGFERDLDYGLVDLGEINFDLGIDYNPAVRFDESIEELGASIEGLPQQLRSLDIYLNVTQDNLDTISTDIIRLSSDIAAVDESLSATPELLDEYIVTVTTVQDNLRRTKTQIEQQTETAKTMLLGIAIWFGLIHLTPLYLGFEMMFGKRKQIIVEQMVTREVVREIAAEVAEEVVAEAGEGDQTETTKTINSKEN